ncbi:hypothetical protein HYW60_00745 [Candidatus Kaiserbacteria bacterium]|nr:hypothetical protein [Candidatus Kaiserbacteria bacterium]
MKSTHTIAVISIALMLLLVPLAFAAAQTVTTPYWCQSGQTGYWSSYPCSSYLPTGQAGNYSYTYTNPYQYSYTYPYNYQYSYPYMNYNYAYAYPTPSCTITVTSSYGGSSYGYGYWYNQPATLSWSSSGASSAYIYPDVGVVATYGSRTVYPAPNTTYRMTVYGPGGTNTCQATYYQQYPYYQPTYYQQYQYYQPYYQYYQYPSSYNYPYSYWW